MKEKNFLTVDYEKTNAPSLDNSGVPIMLTDKTMRERKEKLLALMTQKGIDSLFIYADLEHGSNFEYLVGFLPRFEEAVLVLHKDGEAFLLLGNENLNKADYSRIKATGIHVPQFSLPNQPMTKEQKLTDIFRAAGLAQNQSVGIVGWKLFTAEYGENSQTYDIPHYLVQELQKVNANVINCTDFFIRGEYGVRVINNANEMAHYEFGASLASDSILKALDKVEVGITEMELGNTLNQYGQKNSVVTIAATGKRFEKGNLYPTDKKVKLQDPVSLTVGYKGGLSSRTGYVVQQAKELPKEQQDYLEVVVKPYFRAMVTWLESISCGMSGAEMYRLINQVLPKEEYHWTLCPGHLTSDEEWMSSPIYEGSPERIKSGMIFQTDIIPSVAGYAGVSGESTIALADEELRKQLQIEYPDLWKRIQVRRMYIQKELNINIGEEVLPLASTVGYLRPYLLKKDFAMKKRNQ